MDIATVATGAGALIGIIFKILRDESHNKKNGNGAVMKKLEEIDAKIGAVVSKQSNMEGVCSQARGNFDGQIKGLDIKIFEHMRDHHNIGAGS